MRLLLLWLAATAVACVLAVGLTWILTPDILGWRAAAASGTATLRIDLGNVDWWVGVPFLVVLVASGIMMHLGSPLRGHGAALFFAGLAVAVAMGNAGDRSRARVLRAGGYQRCVALDYGAWHRSRRRGLHYHLEVEAWAKSPEACAVAAGAKLPVDTAAAP